MLSTTSSVPLETTLPTVETVLPETPAVLAMNSTGAERSLAAMFGFYLTSTDAL